jgi:hypothetical protein
MADGVAAFELFGRGLENVVAHSVFLIATIRVADRQPEGTDAAKAGQQ